MQRKTKKLEDLTFTKLKTRSEGELLKVMERQSKSAELDIVNSIELLSSEKRDNKLFNSYNYSLMHLRCAQRELKCKLDKIVQKK